MNRKSAFLASLSLACALVTGCNQSPAADAADGEAPAESGGFFSSMFSGPPPTVVPAGTPLRVRTTTTLSTDANGAGESFVAHLEEDLVIDGKIVARKGAQVDGRITASDKGGRVKRVASMGVTIDAVETVDGKVDVAADDYVKVAKKTHGKDAQKIGIGAGVGAAIGAIAGGGDGALKGAGVGGGAGTGAVLATRGDPAVIASESVLTLTLQAPVSVQVDP